MSGMWVAQARLIRRFAMLVAAFSVISLALAGCQLADTSGGAASTNSGGQGYAITTPNPALNTPTPTFPPFTIGAWPSNYSPNADDTITIYVLCRVQDPSMSTPAQPPNPPVQVLVQPESPVNGSYTATTDAHGLAAVSVTFTDPSAGQPVIVDVHVTYKNVTYNAQTFFTPSPASVASPTPTGTPSVTPSPTP